MTRAVRSGWVCIVLRCTNALHTAAQNAMAFNFKWATRLQDGWPPNWFLLSLHFGLAAAFDCDREWLYLRRSDADAMVCLFQFDAPTMERHLSFRSRTVNRSLCYAHSFEPRCIGGGSIGSFMRCCCCCCYRTAADAVLHSCGLWKWSRQPDH